jgi:hypothetical protein
MIIREGEMQDVGVCKELCEKKIDCLYFTTSTTLCELYSSCDNLQTLLSSDHTTYAKGTCPGTVVYRPLLVLRQNEFILSFEIRL